MKITIKGENPKNKVVLKFPTYLCFAHPIRTFRAVQTARETVNLPEEELRKWIGRGMEAGSLGNVSEENLRTGEIKRF